MKQQGELYESSNVQHTENTMRLMLDSNDILREVEIFLKGYYVQPTYDKENGATVYEKVVVGQAKANEVGVQSLMFWLRTKINPLTSLANVNSEQYGDFLGRARLALARNLMSQREAYGISLANYTEIIDVVMEQLETFLTSSINGGHRKAFTSNQKSEIIEKTEKEKNRIFGGLI